MLNYQNDIDRIFHAMADPTRRQMVERLGKGSLSVSELGAPFAMSLPAIVQHLKVLEDSGLVRTRKQGRVRTCTLETKAVEAASDWFAGRRADWENRLDRLGDYLDRHMKETEND